jgi:hypothetical protein
VVQIRTGVRYGRVLSLLLFNTMIYEILNEVRGENRRPDLKTLCRQCVDLGERWNLN